MGDTLKWAAEQEEIKLAITKAINDNNAAITTLLTLRQIRGIISKERLSEAERDLAYRALNAIEKLLLSQVGFDSAYLSMIKEIK